MLSLADPHSLWHILGAYPFLLSTVSADIIVDPERCFQELTSEIIRIWLWERPCLELYYCFQSFSHFALLAGQIPGISLKAVNFGKKVL